jgi:hypothetical protein
MQWQNLIPLIDNALSGQDDVKGTLMIVEIPSNHLQMAWRKSRTIIELSKDQNPFSNKDKRSNI